MMIFAVITIVMGIGALMIVGKAGAKDNVCNYGQVGEDSDLDR